MASAASVPSNEPGAITVSSGALSISSPEILWHGGGNAAGKPDPVFAVDMHPDGILATAGVDGSVPPNGTVRLWRVSVDSVIEAQREEHMNNFLCDLSDHPRGAVNICRFSPNGFLLASASERQVVVYSVKSPSDWGKITEDNLKTLVDRQWYRPSLEEIRDLAWSPDSTHVVVGSIDNKAEILRLESREATQLTGHQNYVQGVAWDPLDAFVLTQSADRSIRAYNLKPRLTGKPLKLASKGLGGTGGNPQVIKMHGGYEAFPQNETKELTAADFGVVEEGKEGEMKKKAGAGKNLFADYTVPSFFRRLSFSPDGNLVIAPSGIFRNMPLPESLHPSPDLEANLKAAKGNFCTHIFSRWNMATPIVSLAGLDEPSVAIRFSPTLYELVTPPGENAEPKAIIPGDYRAVFAVITLRAVLIYDTQHPYPLAKIGGFHLACINDATWSPDGRLLTVCSSDGYLSFVRFAEGSLGVPLKSSKIPVSVKAGAPYLHKYSPPVVEPEVKSKKAHVSAASASSEGKSSDVSSPERIAKALLDQQNGAAVGAVAPKSGGADSTTKRKRLTPVPVNAESPSQGAVVADAPSVAQPQSAEKTLGAIKASTCLSTIAGSSASGDKDAAEGSGDAKKKRRIAPTLVTNLEGISATSSSSSSSSSSNVTAPVPVSTTKADETAAAPPLKQADSENLAN